VITKSAATFSICISLLLLAGSQTALAASGATARGPRGQTLTVAQTTSIVSGTKVTVTGKGYDPKVGIYVTYCVIPKRGQRPELCGPFDVTGQNNQSIWISSNPPIYAALLVTPFKKGGSFKVTIPVQRMIGDKDCTVVRCAVLTRADHTRTDYRMADVIVPVTLKR